MKNKATKIELPGSFLADLDPKDLERLRAVTKQAFAHTFPGGVLPDHHCDLIIERLGPEIAVEQVRKAVDTKQVN